MLVTLLKQWPLILWPGQIVSEGHVSVEARGHPLAGELHPSLSAL